MILNLYVLSRFFDAPQPPVTPDRVRMGHEKLIIEGGVPAATGRLPP